MEMWDIENGNRFCGEFVWDCHCGWVSGGLSGGGKPPKTVPSAER
ncbi:hypothetical protein GCM10011507_16120 [Edaphobacter acidisoli]|uniref:Uncharacterized protein n=1 Tax=Edaphobacter acidisoli TaxID=2040573 RepID=A0A916RQZ6_9BACT|nr:hypothetical protein GCM10011507_16120 [Edaphobacter acidisoli]